MSYEPTIIVEAKDLQKIERELQRLAYIEDNKVAKYLDKILSYKPCQFKDMEIYIFQPELTPFNQKVRDFLAKRSIIYGEDN